jgi:hypothetical protein
MLPHKGFIQHPLYRHNSHFVPFFQHKCPNRTMGWSKSLFQTNFAIKLRLKRDSACTFNTQH